MNLDKFNKIIWMIIGLFVLLCILTTCGGIVFGALGSRIRPASGISIKSERPDEKNQIETKVRYEMPLLVEGSEYLLVPVSLQNIEKNKNGSRYFSKISYSSSSSSSMRYTKIGSIDYGYFSSPCTNIVFLSKKSGQAEGLLNKKAYIDGIYFPEKRYFVDKNTNETKPSFILLRMGLEDTNKDGVINSDDALSGYVVGLDGKGLKQVTPATASMGSWTYDSDSQKLYIRITADSDGDLKYTEQDDISTIAISIDNLAMGQELLSTETKDTINKIALS